jgi:KDO2-lipid IV(A) lauroyltransferase
MKAHVIEEATDCVKELGRELLLQGKGAIIISAHLGNFELIAPWLGHSGFRGPVMYRPQNNWRVERLAMGARGQYFDEMVPRGPLALLSLMYALREGRGVGLMIDQNTIQGGVFVDFLGFLAASPPGAAALALATRCPVMLAVSIREPDGRYRLIFHPPFELIDTGDRQRDIVANTQQYMKAIERYVLAFPEQYLWAHPRWRFRPNGRPWRLAVPSETMAAERITPPRRPLFVRTGGLAAPELDNRLRQKAG